MEQRPAVGDRLSARPAELLDHIGDGLGQDDVARRDRMAEAEPREADRRAVDGEHGGRRAKTAAWRDGDRVSAEPTDGRVLVQAHAGLDGLRAQPEREPGGVDRRGRPQDRAAEEARVAARAELVRADRAHLVGHAERRAGLDRVGRGAELRLARRDHERRRCAVPPVDRVPFAPLPDPQHPALGRAGDGECPLVADTVAEDWQIVPERRDEAAVAPARPVPREPRFEDDDVARRLERLQLPGRPEAEVPAPDDHHVGAGVRLERRARLDRPGLLEPPAVPRVPQALHGASLTGGILRLRAVAVAQLVEPRVVVPVVAGSSPVRHLFPPVTTIGRHRPRSSADRAAGFEPASGGSTPPGAMSTAAPMRDARGLAWRLDRRGRPCQGRWLDRRAEGGP